MRASCGNSLDLRRVAVSRATFELLEFEVHLLRGIVQTLLVELACHGARLAARRARLRYQAAMHRALRDPDYRRRMS